MEKFYQEDSEMMVFANLPGRWETSGMDKERDKF